MKLPDIKVLVRRWAHFNRYECGELWYRIEYEDDELRPTYFEFPVPTSDTGSGVFLSNDSGLYFMRWIRKHLELIKKGYEDEGL